MPRCWPRPATAMNRSARWPRWARRAWPTMPPRPTEPRYREPDLEATLDTLPLVTIPPEDEALRGPIRAFLQEALRDVPAPVRARTWMGFDGEFSRALARQGWIGLSLPREYGGAGRSAFARFVLVEELIAAGAPVSAHWFADRQTAPLILRYGSEAQKQFFLPRLIRGEIFICIGMSEPDTGSDLSSVRTRAVRTETGWRLNGRKIWTTNAHRAQYMCALVRTSGQHGDRHQGLSQVLIDLSLPGISARPIRDLAGDGHFCEVVFEDVELPADALVGEEGSGWKQVTAELAFERSGPERPRLLRRRRPERGIGTGSGGRARLHRCGARVLCHAARLSQAGDRRSQRVGGRGRPGAGAGLRPGGRGRIRPAGRCPCQLRRVPGRRRRGRAAAQAAGQRGAPAAVHRAHAERRADGTARAGQRGGGGWRPGQPRPGAGRGTGHAQPAGAGPHEAGRGRGRRQGAGRCAAP
ncbi:putative enzyme [Cupriavidus taiwanensis]|nr:putative enzyme [Cupriavidus taiwanensis]